MLRMGNLAEWVNGAKLRWMFGALNDFSAAILSLRWRTQARLRAQSDAMLRQRRKEVRAACGILADLIEKLSVDGTREYVSSASYRILGREPFELVERISSKKSSVRRSPSGPRRGESCAMRWRLPRPISFERPDGTRSWLETSMSPSRTRREASVASSPSHGREPAKCDAGRTGYSGQHRRLTGLANRRAFDIRLDALLREAEEETKRFRC